ncbi:MAG TPA: hypothetical protein VHO25_07575, partial [Polyangiaceae bacterium]|nr:hypothetical protein [Polyangiaceae bacterium]
MVQLKYIPFLATLLGCGASVGTNCGEGTTVRDGVCVPAVSCGSGTVERNGVCVASSVGTVSNGGAGGTPGQPSGGLGGGSVSSAGSGGAAAMPEPDPVASQWTESGAAFAHASCSVGEAGILSPQTVGEFESLLTRGWLRCQGNVVFGLSETE